MLSCVLIIPSTLKVEADLLAVYMGWGPNSYSVPLSPNGTGSATHYGLHAWVTPEFATMLEDATGGTMPQDLSDAGYSQDDFLSVVSNLISSIKVDVEGHFDSVVSANNLSRFDT